MNQDSLTLYRLIVLHMLNKAAGPLSSAQIADFILEKEYTGYITLQQVLSDLTEEAFISATTMENRTLYEITGEGQKTLSFFDNRIQHSIKTDIQEYLSAHEIQIRSELSILTNYKKESSGDYVAELIAKDNGNELIHISLTVPSAEFAAKVCQNWKEKNEAVYQYLVQELF
ncbi:MAG: DUF4364 family protein [bacterium]|nr:DUF4364 family protein [bacterium]